MPWSQTSPMDEKRRFVADCYRGIFTMAELCDSYGISRKTGYKWLRRFECEGPTGLNDRSRKPKQSPSETSPELVRALIELRRRHPNWGAKKLLKILKGRYPQQQWPRRSTACDILRRNGLISKTRRVRRPGHPGRPTTPMTKPNEIWTADFKGQFKTRDGIYCYPLTIADGYSRYLLECHGLLSTKHAGAKKVFRRVFGKYGLPEIIRTDNGVPFATTGLCRLSRLAVWWVRLGIYPELIEPASPQQNGRHERMHRTLKAETTRPPAATRLSQQRRFNSFCIEFNEERPHEALDLETPASIYRRSTRPYPRKLAPVEYPSHFEKRLVSRNGGIRWNCEWVNVSHVLGGEYIGLEEVDDRIWDVYFGPLKLGRMNEKDLRIEDALGRKRRKRVLPMSPD